MDFYAPQFNPQPDFLRSYLQGATAQNAITQSNQATQEGALQLQRNQIQAQVLKQYMDELHGQQAGAQNQTGGNSGGIQNGPQSSVSQPSAQGQTYQPNGWTPQAANIFTPNVSPSTMAAMSLVSPDTVKAMVEAQKSQLQTAQLHALDPNGGSVLPTLIGLANDPNAAQALKNNPRLLQSWEIAAKSAGVDPAKLFSDKPGEADYAVKTVAYQMASPTLQQLGLQDRIKRPEYQSTVNGPLGSVYQQDSDTQKLTQVKGEESLHQVVGNGGTPQLLPASQAAGKQPFNASIFGASNLTDQALQFAADTYRQTGKFPTTMGRSPAMQARVLDRVAQDAAANGDTGASIAARAASRAAAGTALTQNQKLETATTGYLNTLEKNFDSLMPLLDKVDSSGSPLLNKAVRAWQQGVTGDPEVAKYVTYLSSIQGEFAKLKSGSLGNAPASDSARSEAADVINKYMSSGQIKALREAMLGEGNNRISAIREQTALLQQSLGGGASQAATAQQQAPQAAIDHLKQNPSLAPAFKAKYGYLPSGF